MENLSFKALSGMGYSGHLLKDAPVRIMQFGEGNFLRAFVDYFIDIANEKAGFNTKVNVVQPINQGLADTINSQDGLYTVILRGLEDGAEVVKKRIVSSINKCINPYSDYKSYMELAKSPELRFIVSNTTEAGIVYDSSCSLEDTPPSSFPAKLTQFLYERFKIFGGDTSKGFIILSCELIDDNGKELERCVNKYIEQWNLGEDFKSWVNNSNYFCNTLVDRIVTGYPHSEADKINAENGYVDRLLVTGEVFALWVIEVPEEVRGEFPFEKAGLPVILTDNCLPYKKRKVRLLNGLHTSVIQTCYLYGEDIVKECMKDENLLKLMKKMIYDEIIPAANLPKEDTLKFADSVFDRFSNPFIEHKLLDISLNHTSKWRARVLPTVKEYVEAFSKLPAYLVFGFASYIALFRGNEMRGGALVCHRDGEEYLIKDDKFVLDFYFANKDLSSLELAEKVCRNTQMWGEDLSAIPGFAEAAAGYLSDIEALGMKPALLKIL